jgi:uncharacterized protein YoxC
MDPATLIVTIVAVAVFAYVIIRTMRSYDRRFEEIQERLHALDGQGPLTNLHPRSRIRMQPKSNPRLRSWTR